MTSEGLGEVFEGDSADTCAGKFPLVSNGGRANDQACADGERGPPSARVEIYSSDWSVSSKCSPNVRFLGGKRGYFENLSNGSKT